MCGWQGPATEADKSLQSQLFDLSCPRCDKMLLIVNHPTLEQTRAAAEAGNDAARRSLAGLEGEDLSAGD